MKPPIIVNESASMELKGPFYIFKTAAALEAYLEPWYVDEPHFIFDSEGLQLEITAQGSRIHLSPKRPEVVDVRTAREYFATFLKNIAQAKGWSFAGVTEDFVDAAPLSELAAASAKFSDG